MSAEMIVEVARRIGRAGHRFASHNWRGPSSAHLGGWQVARCLHFLSVLVGAVGTEGGTDPNAWSKFRPQFFDVPPPQEVVERTAFPDRVSARALRNELPVAALSQRRPRQDRRLFHPRLQSGLDVSGRLQLDRGAVATNRKSACTSR